MLDCYSISARAADTKRKCSPGMRQMIKSLQAELSGRLKHENGACLIPQLIARCSNPHVSKSIRIRGARQRCRRADFVFWVAQSVSDRPRTFVPMNPILPVAYLVA